MRSIGTPFGIKCFEVRPCEELVVSCVHYSGWTVFTSIQKRVQNMIPWPYHANRRPQLVATPSYSVLRFYEKTCSRSLIYKVMPDHSYSSIDNSKTYKPSGLLPILASPVAANTEARSSSFVPETQFGESAFPNLDCKTEFAFPVFDHKTTFGRKIRKNPRRKQTIKKWLRDRISGIDIGVEIEKENGKHPIHINTNSQVLEHFERLRNGERSFMKRLSDMNFLDHFTEVATFYFAGAAESKKPETLVLIDIDCKKTGTLEGAMAFAKHLRKYHFPNLYIEVSTHGNGAHGYFVLDKLGTGDTYVNNLLLHRLQPWLRQILNELDHDVENVEIKGTLPDIVWGKEKLEVANCKSGTLAKLPRLGSKEKRRISPKYHLADRR